MTRWDLSELRAMNNHKSLTEPENFYAKRPDLPVVFMDGNAHVADPIAMSQKYGVTRIPLSAQMIIETLREAQQR